MAIQIALVDLETGEHGRPVHLLSVSGFFALAELMTSAIEMLQAPPEPDEVALHAGFRSYVTGGEDSDATFRRYCEFIGEQQVADPGSPAAGRSLPSTPSADHFDPIVRTFLGRLVLGGSPPRGADLDQTRNAVAWVTAVAGRYERLLSAANPQLARHFAFLSQSMQRIVTFIDTATDRGLSVGFVA